MKKTWINPEVKKLGVEDTNTLDIPFTANCNASNGISWPSGILGPVWNNGQNRYDCSSRGQGDGVNGHLPDGDPNKIPKCPYIGPNGECYVSSSVIS